VPKATFALMIFVHRSNPLASLSTEQLARMFGVCETPGEPPAAGKECTDGPTGRSIRTWGQLGLKGVWAKRRLHLYGFTLENDKSLIFSQLVFKKGERWSCGLQEFSNAPGKNGADAGELIAHAVAKDPNGIGISNVHYATAQVRAVALSTQNHPVPIAPTRDNVATNLYPLTRAVYMVLDDNPRHEPSDATVEFLRYVLSRQGREAVLQEGNYLPVTGAVAAAEIRKLGPS
jgi:phosphate transport system substrate-binding protein